jgi:CRISPR-associated protein Cas5d
MKVERVSYDVITPSAARAVFEAIFWKPSICWQVSKIEVLNPIKWINLRRNEVSKVASMLVPHIYADNENVRQQRAGLFLRDVKYRLHASFELRDPTHHKPNFLHLGKRAVNEGEEDLEVEVNLAVKFMSMFERRAAKGQCVNQPYLGCREFAATFKLVDPEGTPEIPIPETRDLGYMLYDLE